MTLHVGWTGRLPVLAPWLLGFGLAFSVATQMRHSGLPVGPGEVLLGLWVVATLPLRSFWQSRCLAYVGVILALITVLLALGFATGRAMGAPSGAVLHDVLAYGFCAVLVVNYCRLADRTEAVVAQALLWGLAASTVAAVTLGVWLRPYSGIDALYYGVRWQHLATNPNQFALLVLPLPFLIHFFYEPATKTTARLLLVLCYAVVLGLGWYSGSDALTLAWLFGGAILAVGLWSRRAGPRLPASANGAARPAIPPILIAMVAVLMIGSAAQWSEKISGVVATIADTSPATVTGGSPKPAVVVNAEQAQAVTRFSLWRNAVLAIKMAPWTGFGPGPHSGATAPLQGEEAHNTLLDWGTQTGVLGMALLIVYQAGGVLRVLAQRRSDTLALVLALYSYSLFHDLLRQPLFWLVPLLALGLAADKSSASASGWLPRWSTRRAGAGSD